MLTLVVGMLSLRRRMATTSVAMEPKSQKYLVEPPITDRRLNE